MRGASRNPLAHFGNVAVPPTGLLFPGNGAAGGDIRLIWDGSILLPRTSHTAIWSVKHAHQLGYFATAWHVSSSAWSADTYEFGTHPYPCDGAKDGTGQSTNGTGGSGAVQYFEVAGLGAYDYISSAGGSSTLLVDDTWYTQARICYLSGSDRVHRFYPDVVNAPSVYIEQIKTDTLATPAAPAFMFGSSPWTSPDGGNTNSECLSGILRNISLFNAPLSITDIAAEAAATGNSPVTSAGAAACWYINKNPTPSDVTDKSGQGRNPSWANANRPTLYAP